MKKVLKLVLYIVLSFGIVYSVISNIAEAPNIRMAVDFIKHGSEKDVVNYSKQIDKELRNSLDISEDTVISGQTIEDTEKTYENINELAIDYPMGTTFYSMTMARGENQIEYLCISVIFAIIIGTNCFMFITDKKLEWKQILKLFIINLVVSLITIEVIQLITLVLAYGTIYFVTIEMQFVLAAIAIFVFALAINKSVYDAKEQKATKEQELKEKISSKMNKKNRR